MASLGSNLSDDVSKKEILVDKILFLETNSEYLSYFRNVYLTLGRFCKEIHYFNRRENYLKYGKDKMNIMLLDLVEKEKPDYIFTWLTWDEFYIDTLLKIRKISPKTKTVAIFGDDTIQYLDFSRFYSLVFDYSFSTLKSYVGKYRKDGVQNIFFTSLTDAVSFHPIKTKYKYDITFIGSTKLDNSGRREYVNYLKNNGLKVRVFGYGWENYPELKDIYGGPLGSEEIVKVINESKINLCFSKDNFGKPQMKAKIFEVGACNSFTLCEYASDYDSYFKAGEDIVFFRNQKELLENVNYYLKNDSERLKISEKAYKRVIKYYSLHNEIRNFILKTRNDTSHKDLPKMDKSVFDVTEKEMSFGLDKLKNLLKNSDFVSFSKGKSEVLKYRDYFHKYSLEKSGKDISCCNYYVYSKNLGDYLLFFSRDALNLLDKSSYEKLFDINQLMVRKEYFLENYNKFRDVFDGGKIDFVNLDTTSFVAIPLVRINEIKTSNYKELKTAFSFKFNYQLYSLKHEKKIFWNKYAYSLLLSGLLGKGFILRSLFETVSDKGNWAKVKKMG